MPDQKGAATGGRARRHQLAKAHFVLWKISAVKQVSSTYLEVPGGALVIIKPNKSEAIQHSGVLL